MYIINLLHLIQTCVTIDIEVLQEKHSCGFKDVSELEKDKRFMDMRVIDDRS
jgi:hypothetical protein